MPLSLPIKVRSWPLVIALVAGALFELTAFEPAAAQTSAVSASFQPGTLALPSGVTRTAVLLLSNDTRAAVANLQVSYPPDPGITIKPAAAPKLLAAGGSAAVTVTFSRAVYSSADASVEAVLTYTAGSGRTAIAEASVAVLTITPPGAPASLAGPIGITSSLGTAQLVEYQSTDVFFTLTNQSEQTQKLSSAQLNFPQSLSLQVLSPGKAAPAGNGTLNVSDLGSLQPGDTTVLHLRLTADGPLQPGDALIVLIVRPTSQADHSTSTAVTSQKITFSVLGESGVLQVLGVPSLLFVPGIVLAVVLWALWTYVYPRRTFTVSPGTGIEGKAAMWVFALLPSLALPFVYPTITGWFGPGRDYRKSYGLDDILYVWIIAAVLAFIGWALGVVIRWLALCLLIPQEHDSERQLLRKFAIRRWHHDLDCPSATYDSRERVIILANRAGKKLVTPAIAYTVNELTDAERAELEDLISKSRTISLWWFLRKRKAKVTLAYAHEPGQPLADPTLVDSASMGEFEQDRLIRSS